MFVRKFQTSRNQKTFRQKNGQPTYDLRESVVAVLQEKWWKSNLLETGTKMINRFKQTSIKSIKHCIINRLCICKQKMMHSLATIPSHLAYKYHHGDGRNDSSGEGRRPLGAQFGHGVQAEDLEVTWRSTEQTGLFKNYLIA